MGQIVVRDTFADHMDQELTKAFVEGAKTVDDSWKQLFIMEKWGNYQGTTKTHKAVLGLSDFELTDEGDSYKEDTIDPGRQSTYRVEKYTKKIRVTEEMKMDGRFPEAIRQALELGKAYRRTQAKQAASVLKNGFTVNGNDGVPMFSNSHPLLYPSASVTTFDNKITAKFSHNSLKSLIQQMTRQYDNKGELLPSKMGILVTHPNMMFIVEEVIKSITRSDTADRAKNVMQGIVKPVYLEYLEDDGDDSPYFGMDKNNATLRWYTRTPLTTKVDKIEDGDVYVYLAKGRWAYGYDSPYGLVGSDASTAAL